MTSTKKVFFLLLVQTTLVSCLSFGDNKNDALDPEDFNYQSAVERYEMKIPKYMKSTSGLNADATMQYQNLFREAYLAVIEEPTEDFVSLFKDISEYDENLSSLENYKTTQIEYFKDAMEVSFLGDPVSKQINGLDAIQLELIGTPLEMEYEIYYLFTFVEGANDLYMIMHWTLSEKQENLEETYAYMAESFREIK